MTYDRFDHGQQILKCWNVTDDLKTVLEVLDSSDMKAEDKDRIENMLVGIIDLYDAKFDKLFGMFEQSLKDNG